MWWSNSLWKYSIRQSCEHHIGHLDLTELTYCFQIEVQHNEIIIPLICTSIWNLNVSSSVSAPSFPKYGVRIISYWKQNKLWWAHLGSLRDFWETYHGSVQLFYSMAWKLLKYSHSSKSLRKKLQGVESSASDQWWMENSSSSIAEFYLKSMTTGVMIAMCTNSSTETSNTGEYTPLLVDHLFATIRLHQSDKFSTGIQENDKVDDNQVRLVEKLHHHWSTVLSNNYTLVYIFIITLYSMNVIGSLGINLSEYVTLSLCPSSTMVRQLFTIMSQTAVIDKDLAIGTRSSTIIRASMVSFYYFTCELNTNNVSCASHLDWTYKGV